jgi:hypothetical protein
MSEDNPRLRDALEELQSYLADNLPPLLVADSIGLLIDYPPGLTAEQLRAWAAFQYQGRRGQTPLADLLYHATKKIQQLEEMNLVPKERFDAFLTGLVAALVEACPPEERERFLGLLRHLRETVGAVTGLVSRIHAAGLPPPGSAAAVAPAPAAPALTAAEVRDLRRFTLLLERSLGASPAAGGAAAAPDGTAQQLLVLAASGARSAPELEQRISRLRDAGMAPASQEIVKALIGAVPDWAVAAAGGVRTPATGSIEAVRKAVKLAGSGQASAERWKQLLKAAAEQFNKGAFGRAITLVDLAERMVKDGEIEWRFAEIERGHAHEAYDTTALLQAAAEARHRPILRRLVEFHPGWSVRELLDQLVFQPDQKRRRLLLSLLESWGVDARTPVVERLETSLSEPSRDPNVWWYQRNLVFLLHRLPRPAGGGEPKRELDLVAPLSAFAHHPSFQREAITLLATLPGQTGVPVLLQRLAEGERALEANPPAHPPQELWKVLGAICAALIRSGSPSGRRAVVEHALARNPRAGETVTRLRDLGSIDLSGDRELVDRLAAELRELLPRKVLGISMGGDALEASHVARALAATAAPAARQAVALFQERLPDLQLVAPAGIAEESAQAQGSPSGARAPEATDPSETFVPAAAARPAMSGDLEVFGLPGLLQNLQSSEASGRLVLRDPKGLPLAEMRLIKGRLVECRSGRLSGEAAFYQLFEVPIAGTFELTRSEVTEPGRSLPTHDVIGLLMEAMRRYDELQRARAVVPDSVMLRPGETRPTAPPEESDGELVRQIWGRVREGARAADCESAVAVDAFRVRTLLAHWLEEGALVAAPVN